MSPSFSGRREEDPVLCMFSWVGFTHTYGAVRAESVERDMNLVSGVCLFPATHLTFPFPHQLGERTWCLCEGLDRKSKGGRVANTISRFSGGGAAEVICTV